MELINKICRLCLSSQTDKELAFALISSSQKEKFEEISGIELPIDPGLPAQICTGCADHLENFYLYR